MDKFLGTYSPPKLNKEEIGNLDRTITRSETESVKQTNNLLQAKFQASLRNSTKHTENNLYLPLSNDCKITEEWETVPNSYYEDNITLIPKSDKHNTKKKKNYRPVSFTNTDVKILKNISKMNSTT